jgi:hypothetical protein
MLVLITFHSDKRFGLANNGQRVLVEYKAVSRRSDASNALPSTATVHLQWLQDTSLCKCPFMKQPIPILLILPLKRRLHLLSDITPGTPEAYANRLNSTA